MLLEGQAPLTVETALDVLYQTVLESIGSWDDDDFVHDFRKLMGVVITSKNPLSSIAIEQLLDLPPEQPLLHTISRLGCVLSQNPTIRVLHPSFADFLCTQARCGRDIWFFDPVAHNRILAIRCLQLLNGTLNMNLCNLSLSVDQEAEQIPEEVAYACVFWIDHICGVKHAIQLVLVYLKIFCIGIFFIGLKQ